MPSKELTGFLDDQKVKYALITHSPAYTAQEIAASAHISGKELAKTVVIKVDGQMALAVLPASYHVDCNQLAASIAADRVELAEEHEFQDLFPGCELGAMPPFGNLYGLEVYVAEALAEDEQIAFNAGTHTELIQLDYVDFQRLAHPRIVNFAERS